MVSHITHGKTRDLAEMAKRCTPSHTDVIFVVMDAFVRIYEDDLICHKECDCHAVALRACSELSQSADCKSERPRVWSELLQLAGGCQSERSRVRSGFHCCQDEDEDEVQVIGCCHDQDVGCHSALSHSSSSLL